MADLLIPPLPVADPAEASFHVLNRFTGIERATIASLLCYSDNGPIMVNVEGVSSRLTHFRPETTVYHPLNQTAGGNLLVKLGDGPSFPRVVVTFVNNGETEGQVALIVGFDVTPDAARVPLKLRRRLLPKSSTSFHMVFIDQ